MRDLIATAEFYNSRGLSDEKLPEGPGNLIAAAGFYISRELGDEKSHRRSGILQF